MSKNLPARTTESGAIIPDEVIDPTQFANDLTVEVGASARFAFRRSVRADTGGIRQAAAQYAEHLEEWPAFAREVFAHLYDPDELKPLPQDEQSTFARAAIHGNTNGTRRYDEWTGMCCAGKPNSDSSAAC